MTTTAVRIHGVNDLRLSTFDLPALSGNELRGRVMTDTVSMPTYEMTVQGAQHERVPANIYERPAIIGHETCGEIVECGPSYSGPLRQGDRFVIRPALNDKNQMNGQAAVG
ncbi:MAG: alcohol dehydrogenase catalytic domain-containing protein, partial [Spirochaetaceae bacterium]|nr:alcohol dehydrogenase catalytic domain-containing protein [Spirochaetaceae bacterium]